MIHSITEFEKTWSGESEGTLKILGALSDASLTQAVSPNDRTLGRVAWHIVTSVPEMMGRTGLKGFPMPAETPMPGTAKGIADAYAQVSSALIEQVRANWTDQTLQIEDDMYGDKWARGLTLGILMLHQTHHRGQMTVLMRQAGLVVPGVYGPAREEWSKFGAPAPEI
jgi:uncharacterized damage-inducible protein DinB